MSSWPVKSDICVSKLEKGHLRWLVLSVASEIKMCTQNCVLRAKGSQSGGQERKTDLEFRSKNVKDFHFQVQVQHPNPDALPYYMLISEILPSFWVLPLAAFSHHCIQVCTQGSGLGSVRLFYISLSCSPQRWWNVSQMPNQLPRLS